MGRCRELSATTPNRPRATTSSASSLSEEGSRRSSPSSRSSSKHRAGRYRAPVRPGTIEVLGQRAGSDGYYWQIGAVVAPTTFPSSGPGAKTGLTEFEVRLFQVSDSE
jgi:hypothetical protein